MRETELQYILQEEDIEYRQKDIASLPQGLKIHHSIESNVTTNKIPLQLNRTNACGLASDENGFGVSVT